MKSIAIVSSLLLSTSSYVQATSLSELALRPPLLRRAAEELDSNDKIDYLSFQKYNCEGMFLDWSGPSAITNTLESKVVEYDYDVYMEKGSDRTSVLASIQNRLLRYVGNDLFLDCSSRRLSEGFAMEEITTAPGDQPSPSTTGCKIDAEYGSNDECMAVAGAMSVFYTSSGDKALDEATIDDAIKASVKTGMDSGVCNTDTTHGVYYIGDRDSILLTSAEKYYGVEEPWYKRGQWLMIGTLTGLASVLLLILCFKKRQSSKAQQKEDKVSNDGETEQQGEQLYGEAGAHSVKSNPNNQGETAVDDSTIMCQQNNTGFCC